MTNDLLATADVMREIDRTAIEDYGVPGAVLMENAGAGTAKAILQHWPDVQRVAIIAGSGNNGGDGYVIARHLINNGVEAVTYMPADREKIRGDARINLDVLGKMNTLILDVHSEKDIGLFREALHDYDLVVDAMLGTGLKKDLKGLYRECVEVINAARLPVCAADIPSGLSSDTGKPMGEAVRADMTCTYGLLKIGQVIYPGAEYVGDLVLVDIGLPREVVEQLGGSNRLLMKEYVAGLLPARLTRSHKGDFGHLLVVAASPGKTGAAAMCADAAVRSGAGLVTAAVPASLNPILEAKLTEAMTLPVADGGSGYITPDAWKDINRALERANALAVGPGLAAESGTRELFFKLLAESDLPTVIDADGLNILATDVDALKPVGSRVVLTPHPGEMARLLNTSTKEVQADRIGAARGLAERTGAVVLLKGARSIIAAPDGVIAVNPTGNPGMASGGTGDVLTGIIGALLAQGVEPFDAACAGAWIHGRAGDICAQDLGQISMMAGDMIDALPEVFLELTSNNEEHDRDQ